MKYFITSDFPGRIRIRFGENKLSSLYESPVEDYFSAITGVENTRVSHLTGSVLLNYTGNIRIQILSAAAKLKIKDLTPIQKNENDAGSIVDVNFKKDLFSVISKQLLRRLLMPMPIRKIVTAWNALKFIKSGLHSLSTGKLTVDVLDASAVMVAMGQGSFNTASSIMFLLNLSEILEGYTINKTKSMLSSSLLIIAKNVWIEKDGTELQISTEALAVGDHVIVRTGTIIPVDGTVIKGESIVNQSTMTGEPLGVHKKSADSVFAGTVVEEGSIVVKVTALNKDTRISKIVDMISESEELKASIQGRAEKIADGIVPFSFLLSLGILMFTGNFTKALSVLLVDYSCAIKLSTPISVISVIREASVNKILIKGGKFLESAAEVDTIVFDKTGTLTVASPSVKQVIPMSEFSREEVLRFAACMEEHFPHSVARAIVKAAKKENLKHEEEHTEVEYVVAHGIVTTLHNKRAVIGSHHFICEDENIPITKEQESLINEKANGDSVIYLAYDNKLIGIICITDPLREGAKSTICKLRKLGVNNIIMLTGDSDTAAKVTSDIIGVDKYYAEVLPRDKAEIIKALKKNGRKVMMVGDGINDSPALAAADISVSMKDSSDIAREVSDITLQNSDLSQLITLRLLGKKMMDRIHKNYNFILSFNTMLLLLGIGNAIYPDTSAILHNASTMVISASSMRPCLDHQKGETI